MRMYHIIADIEYACGYIIKNLWWSYLDICLLHIAYLHSRYADMHAIF